MASHSALALLVLLAASSQMGHSVPVSGGMGTLGTENGGSCGYVNFPAAGTFVTGFSEAIYGAGAVCGGCYAVQCIGGTHCNAAGRVIVTATNECMATNTSDPCSKPNAALNLQPVAFDKISNSRAPGVVNIRWIPVPCVRAGGIQFQITTGNQYYLAVLIQNVAGPGALASVFIKAGNAQLTPMTRSFGAVWEINNYPVVGVPLSFFLVGTNGQRLMVPNAIPAGWKPQAFYTNGINFNQRPVPKK